MCEYHRLNKGEQEVCFTTKCFLYVKGVCYINTLHLSSTLCREVPVEPLQIADTGQIINSDKLIDPLQSELLEESWHSGSEEDIEILDGLHEDPTGQTGDLEMCKDVDQNVDLEETADNKEETLIEVAEHTQRIENSQERVELTEKLEEFGYLEQQDCDQTTSQDREPSPQPEHSKSEQLEMTKQLEQIQAEASHQTEEQHSEDSEQLGRLEHLDQSPQMELTEQLIQHENVDETEESIQLDEIVCVEAREPEVAEQEEQMETPAEQNEQSLQMTDVHQPIVSEQVVQAEEIVESEITEQVSLETEVPQQTEEAELNLVDKCAEPSNQAEGVGDTEDGDLQTVVANVGQPKPLETAVPHMNGGEVDREMARHLAERLFKLDGIQRVDVVKHLDKE